MPTIGWFGEDVWNAAKSAIVDVWGALPGSDELSAAITDVWTGPLRDFAKTPLGTMVLTAVSSAAYGPLAYALGGPYGLASFGAQLATLVWALPGLAQGDNFAHAWIAEVIRRAEKTAEVTGGDAAGQLVAQIKGPATDYLESLKNVDPGVFDALRDAPDQLLAESVQTMAKEAGVDDWSMAMALSAFEKELPAPPDWGGWFSFDDNTGALVLPLFGWEQDFQHAGSDTLKQYVPTFADQVLLPSWAKSAAQMIPTSNVATPVHDSSSLQFGASTSPSDASVARKKQGDVMLVVVIAAAIGTYVWWRKKARHA